MCQMSVVMDKNGDTEKILDEVTRLEVTKDGIVLSTFFEDDKLVPNAQIKTIDFMKTTVTLGKL